MPHEKTDSETIVVGATAIGFSSLATKNQHISAVITIEDDDIRAVVAPNADTANGHLFFKGEQIILDTLDELRYFKAVRVTTDATLRVTYYPYPQEG